MLWILMPADITKSNDRMGNLEPLLEVKGLKTYFLLDEGTVQAVDGVDITVPRGTTLG